MERINWLGVQREALKKKLLEIADKQKYGEPITAEEIELLECFDFLTIEKSTKSKIENFFEVLDEVIYCVNKRGILAENGDD